MGWKEATVVPIYKKRSKRKTGYYRPVSLMSIPCKILESLIKDATMNHLITKNLIKDTQNGFMPGRLCATNLLSFLERVTEAKTMLIQLT